MAMLGRREDTSSGSQRSPAVDAHTILGPEARFSGKLTFEGAVRIDGHFEGEVHTNDVLLVGPTAEIHAEIRVGSIIIHGFVQGNIEARDYVEIKAPGRLNGNVVTQDLIIERGVKFDGTCRMSDRNVVELPDSK